MIKFPYAFNKNNLLILLGLLFVSSANLDPLYHDLLEGEHSKVECHFCINNISEDGLPEAILENFSLSNFYYFQNLDIFIPHIAKSFLSRAPPKI
ncbi:hypothetical protein OAL90_01365 [Hyphomicrobiales bacterium]|jgi:hypothetical protein|nr:hypothetical protein [Hyphomicrobiales bacterium]MDC0432266.1 hypothetical protein [Hyphomicrobiales bacterium]|tara:strand:+ start:614 stop:898 length:285 start_codon:yes stop_codon:yes gene_type:complete